MLQPYAKCLLFYDTLLFINKQQSFNVMHFVTGYVVHSFVYFTLSLSNTYINVNENVNCTVCD